MDMPEEHAVVLESAIAQLLGVLELFPEEDTSEAAVERTVDGLGRYSEQVAQIAHAASQAGLPGLQDICFLLQASLVSLATRGQVLEGAEREQLELWPALAMGYIADPGDVQARTLLVEYLQQPIWDIPLPADDAAVLLDLLGITMPAASESNAVPDDNRADELGSTIDSTDSADAISESVAPSEPVHDATTTAALDAPQPELSDEPPSHAPTTNIPGEAEAAINTAQGTEDEDEAPGNEDKDEAPNDISASSFYQELVDMLRAEINLIAESSDETFEIATSPGSTPDSRREILMSYAESFERLAEASAALNLLGLQQVCTYLQININELAHQDHPVSAEQRQAVEIWPPLALKYLQNLHDRPTSIALVDHLRMEHWPQPLPTEETNNLIQQLVTAKIAVEGFEAEAEAKPRQASPDDTSLALPDDVSPQLLEGLLQELPGQAAEFSSAIQNLAGGNGTLEDVKIAQRVAHTLKGAGNTVGVRGIATLTHHIEDILTALSKHEALPNRPLASTLLNAADCLETMSEVLLGQNTPPPEALNVLQEVLDWANYIDSEGIPGGDDTPIPAQQVASTPAGHSSTAEPEPKPASTEATTPEASLRIPAHLIDELLRLVGESIILTGQIQEQFRKTIDQNRLIVTQNRLLQQLASELEQLIDVRNVTSPLSRSMQRGDFDPLELEQYNELNTIIHRLVEVATDSREFSNVLSENLSALDAMLLTQNHLQRDNQEAVLRTRMVPIQTVVPRLQRSVRQTCRLVDKEAELIINGADTLIDSNVLNDLVDPLMHILRNAVDHGIESPEQRQQLGKNPVGQITLTILREGNNIVLRCQDDGSGLDIDSIRHIAIQRKLINAGDDLSDDQIARMILLPGFSTRSDTTQTSGRGIGMDMVHTRVLAMKGTLQLSSSAGRGSLVEMRLPVALISTHGLLVRLRNQILAISNHGIEQIIHSSIGQAQQMGDTMSFRIENAIYELTSLESLFKLPTDHRAATRTIPSVLLVREETDELRAVMVEEVLDSRDLVVKPLGQYVPKLNGIIGATILGDGSVAPVIDLPDMLRTPKITFATLPEHDSETVANAPTQKFVLAVDDSLSARRALSQFAQDAGFKTRSARDGLEAIEIIKGKRPDLILADLEMPRMNGLELTSHLRSNRETADIPIIMITSRATDKHRHEAEKVGVNLYLTKPFMDDDLLVHMQKLLRN